MRDLQTNITEMKSLGEYLISFSYPTVSLQYEKEIKILKQRKLIVDGYDLIVSYSKADLGRYWLETVQIQAEYHPFLPFNIVCKLAVMFLGNNCLSLVEIVRSGHKIYCWTLQTDKLDGNCVIPSEIEVIPCNYQGLSFSSLNPEDVNFY